MNAKGDALKGQKRDGRATRKNSWLKEGIALFAFMLTLNAVQHLIYQASRDVEISFRSLFAPEILLFMLFATAILCGIMMIGRRFVYEKPIDALANVAQRITAGDYSVRLPVKGKKKKGRMEILYEDFNSMAEELAGSETLKTDFIANVSHEIRTPLAVIHNYVDALGTENLSPRGIDYLNTIKSASISMSRMVGNILQLNSLENKEIHPQPVSCNLSEQISQCALAYVERWEEKGLVLESDIDDDIYGCYDRHVLEIVWNNLIDNAIKFTEPGGAIKISLKAENGLAAASFSDTGCGIDEDTGKHIFTKFYQGDSSHAGEGNGLGLALVHKIVELCGGTIHVQSRPGQGSTFTVSLEI